MIRTLPVVVAWLIAGLSIESAAADSEESWTQRWTRALDDVRGTDSARRQASWPSIREIAVYCPRHPELIEAMFSVLSDDGRRDDWDMALTWINQALHAGASLSKRQVELLTEKLAQMNQPQLDSGIVTLGFAHDNSEIAKAALRPFLRHEHATIRTRAAASFLRLRAIDEVARNVLLADIASDSPKVRRCAVYWIGKSVVDTPPFATALQAATKDTDSGVRVLAAYALWHLTKSADEPLNVLSHCLTDESVQISFGTAVVSSAVFPSQHTYTINCLGDMAENNVDAKSLLEQIASRKIAVADDWDAINRVLIAVNGRIKYGTTSFEEAAIRTALAKDDVLSEVALRHFRDSSIETLQSRITQISEFRKQNANWGTDRPPMAPVR